MFFLAANISRYVSYVSIRCLLYLLIYISCYCTTNVVSSYFLAAHFLAYLHLSTLLEYQYFIRSIT